MDQSNYTLPGIMHYLQNQYTIIEKNKILNELEKSELKMKITKLESEKNSLLVENEKLRDRIRKLELNGNALPVNGNGTSGARDMDTSLETAIDTSNLIKAKLFLKNTTNEILYLLNSPSIDSSDPLGLNKDESEFLHPASASVHEDIYDNTRNHLINIMRNGTTEDHGSNGHGAGDHIGHKKSTNDNTSSNSNNTSHSASDLQLEVPEDWDKLNETDTETIIDENDKAPLEPELTEAGQDDKFERKLLEKSSWGSVIYEFSPKTSKSPPYIDLIKADSGFVYAHFKSTDELSIYNEESHELSSLPLVKVEANAGNRLFRVANSYIIEAVGTTFQIHSLDQQKEIPSFELEGQIVSMDCISKGDSLLIAVLVSGELSPRIFEYNESNEDAKPTSQLTPYTYHTLSELPSIFEPLVVKFNTTKELTMIAEDGKVVRYDFSNDTIVSKNKFDFNLWNKSQFLMSNNYLIHITNSTILTILNFETEEPVKFFYDQPFQVSSISICDDYFTLNFSNGTIELYQFSVLEDGFPHNNSSSSMMNDGRSPMPPCLLKFEYYEPGRPPVIKDIVVDVVLRGDSLQIFAAGSDLKIKKFDH